MEYLELLGICFLAHFALNVQAFVVETDGTVGTEEVARLIVFSVLLPVLQSVTNAVVRLVAEPQTALFALHEVVLQLQTTHGTLDIAHCWSGKHQVRRCILLKFGQSPSIVKKEQSLLRKNIHRLIARKFYLSIFKAQTLK